MLILPNIDFAEHYSTELLLGSEEVGSLKEPRFHVFHILQQVLVKVADTYA